MSKYGFFSVVRKSPNEYHIRARVKKDLENVRDAINLVKEILESDEAAYRYRLVVGGEVYRAIMQLLVQSVDYDNFVTKIATTEDQLKKLGAYHQVRGVLKEIPDDTEEEKTP